MVILATSSVGRAGSLGIIPVVVLLRAQIYMAGVGHTLAVDPQALFLYHTSLFRLIFNSCSYHLVFTIPTRVESNTSCSRLTVDVM